MPHATPWTSENHTLLAVLYGRGMSAGAIADEMGLTKGAVAGRLSRTKLRVAQRPNQYRDSPWTDALHGQLIELFERGLAWDDIAARMGLTKNQVAGRLWRHGLVLGKRYRRHYLDYQGPDTLERLRLLHEDMDEVLGRCAELRDAGKLYVRIRGGTNGRAREYRPCA